MLNSKNNSKNKQEHMNETWLIPYADMLTLLLALFIVLFAMSQVDSTKFHELKKALESAFSGGIGILSSDSETMEMEENALDPDPLIQFMLEEEVLREYKEMLDQYLKDQGMQQHVTTRITEKGLQITIQEIALFDSGKADLRPEALDIIKTMAVMLTELDNFVEISGHTDNLPISTPEFPSNWELSVARSLNVMRYMLRNENLKPERFSVVGYGEYRPVSTNDTAEGRAANRRVEVLILRMYMRPPVVDVQ
jgi:chemotaxis protein MotB